VSDGRRVAGGILASKMRKVAKEIDTHPDTKDEIISRKTKVSQKIVRTVRDKLSSPEQNPDNIEVEVNQLWGEQ
jgi:hypothetical protein